MTKTVAGARTLFVCLGQQVICEYVGNSPAVDSPDQRYVYGSYVDEPILKQAGNSILYYSRNQQFSVTALSNASGQVLGRYAYTPYGAVTVLAGSGAARAATAHDNPYTYTGRRSDLETGLLYFRARMYDAKLGRFISRDPLGFVDGMSQYRAYFVPGDVDPSGLIVTLAGCKVAIKTAMSNPKYIQIVNELKKEAVKSPKLPAKQISMKKIAETQVAILTPTPKTSRFATKIMVERLRLKQLSTTN